MPIRLTDTDRSETIKGHHADPITDDMPTKITAEKTMLSQRLAYINADGEKIATQLADRETADRVPTTR